MKTRKTLCIQHCEWCNSEPKWCLFFGAYARFACSSHLIRTRHLLRLDGIGVTGPTLLRDWRLAQAWLL